MADHGDKGGIQLLLAAEQDAQQVVSNARAGRDHSALILGDQAFEIQI